MHNSLGSQKLARRPEIMVDKTEETYSRTPVPNRHGHRRAGWRKELVEAGMIGGKRRGGGATTRKNMYLGPMNVGAMW